MKDWLMRTFLKRYLEKTPIALRIVTLGLGITSFICGLPEMLEYMCSTQEICLLEHLPEQWKEISNKAISVSCAVGVFLTELGVEKDASA